LLVLAIPAVTEQNHLRLDTQTPLWLAWFWLAHIR